MENKYVKNLVYAVIEKSEADNWEDAVLEWDFFDCEEDDTASSYCVCGKENIRYLHTIQNRYNGNLLFPIGSSCIKKFGRRELDSEVKLQEDLFRLLHHIENRHFIVLTSDFFTRKLIDYLYEVGAFDNDYNHYDGYDDYCFFKKMFNKRNKDEITNLQQRKINAIVIKSIYPFLENTIVHKKKA